MAVDAAAECFLGIAGVDIITKDITADATDDSYIIEVNLTPGIRMHQFPTIGQPRDVASSIFAAIEKTSRLTEKAVAHIGRAEAVDFPELAVDSVSARIDTGAKTSAIWASQAEERNGQLEVVFFDKQSSYYSGETVIFDEFDRTVVASSTGQLQTRYKVRLLVKIKGKKVRAWFTLADRSTQVYPVLVGRNILLGKFIVDVKRGKALRHEEQKRTESLRSVLNKNGERS
jgi:hypothetical protein